MSAELIAIIAVGIALAGLLQVRINRLEDRQRSDLNSLEERQRKTLTGLEDRQRSDLNSLEERQRKILTGLEYRIGALERGQAELRERMAKLEGLLEGLREAITRTRVA